jgi:PAS domain S-box-containing protein
MNSLLHRMDRLLPRRLTTRITLAMVGITVAAGVITIGIINQLLLYNLQTELLNFGQTLVQTAGESLANPLVDNNLATIQETLDDIVKDNQDVVYAFAFSPQTPIIHTFSGGFPVDLLHVTPISEDVLVTNTLLQTEQGLVRDFAYRPLDGLAAEIHLGISQSRITAVQQRVTQLMIVLTAVGSLSAAFFAFAFSRIATYPLTELTRRVQRLGKGHLDERIDLPPGDEVGDLAQAFNRMAADIQGAIQQLQTSEAGYRDLLTAASAVGEGIALICDEGSREGVFLFVNEAFAQLAGYQPEDLLDLNAAGILHPDSLPAARQAWQAIRAGEGQSPHELTLVDRHGRAHILETAGTMVEYQGHRALAWFTRDVSQRKAHEEENARLWEELRQKEHLRSKLLARVIRAQEDERQRMARELHDGIGQSLNALVFGLNAVSTAVERTPDVAPNLLQRLKVSTSDTVKELQSIIYDLRPSLLDDLGLIEALRWYARDRLESRHIQVTLHVPDEDLRLPPEIETALFRIGQEAITNIGKHAQANQVAISLWRGEGQVYMEIMDDGIGFVAGSAVGENGRNRWGLIGIQERAALLGGKLSIQTEPNQGTQLTVTLPLETETA